MSTDGGGSDGTRGGQPAPWRPPRPDESGSHPPRPDESGSHPPTSPWASPGGSAAGTHWSAPGAGWGQHPAGPPSSPWASPGAWGSGGWPSSGAATADPWGTRPPDGRGFAPPPARPTRRRGRTVAVLAIVAGVLVVVFGLLAATLGPRLAGTNVLDRAAVERGVAQVVTQDWNRKVDGVSCPSDEPARPGHSFSCRATVDGRPQQVPVDVLDDRGLYQVGQPR